MKSCFEKIGFVHWDRGGLLRVRVNDDSMRCSELGIEMFIVVSEDASIWISLWGLHVIVHMVE
jgi:hypothetical protein